MTKPTSRRPSAALFFALTMGTVFFWSSSSLFAETKPAEQKPVDTEAQTTSATYENWILLCAKQEVSGQAQRLCEVYQTYFAIIQNQKVPFAKIAIGRIKKTDPFRVTLLMLANVMISSAPQIYPDTTNADALELTWQKCFQNSCLADATPKEDILRRWRAAKTSGRIEAKDAANSPIVMTI